MVKLPSRSPDFHGADVYVTLPAAKEGALVPSPFSSAFFSLVCSPPRWAALQR